jgi:hypothetical protein
MLGNSLENIIKENHKRSRHHGGRYRSLKCPIYLFSNVEANYFIEIIFKIFLLEKMLKNYF